MKFTFNGLKSGIATLRADAREASQELRRFIPQAALFGFTSLVLLVMVMGTKVATVRDGDAVEVFRTMDGDPLAIASTSMFELGLEDDVTVNGMTPYFIDISINRPQTLTVNTAEGSQTIETMGGSLYEVLSAAGITLNDGDKLNYTLDFPTYDGMEIDIARVSYEIVTEETAIPYEVRRVSSHNVPVGELVETTPGEEGLSVATLEHKYLNGNLVETTIIEEAVVKEPVTGVVAYGVGGTLPTSRSDTTRYSYYVDMTATAYTYGNSGEWGDVTATGKEVQVGYVAVDPKVIPLGTRLYITYPNGEEFYGFAVAEDVGGAIKGNKIDLFMETSEQCFEFGRRTVRVYVLD